MKSENTDESESDPPACEVPVGSEMIPIVGSKINVNTQTKILALNIKNLQVRKLNHRKESNTNTSDLSWLGPLDLHLVPKQPA